MIDEDGELSAVLAGSLIKMSDTQGVVEEANGFPVSIEQIKRAAKFIARMGPDQDVVKRALALTVLFVGEVDHADLLPITRSIEMRMQALKSLREEAAFRAWSTPMKGRLEVVDEVMVEVAASQPMIERDGRPCFEPDSFFKAVLERGAVRGCGSLARGTHLTAMRFAPIDGRAPQPVYIGINLPRRCPS